VIDISLHNAAASDGYVWSYRTYEPAHDPRAELICLHGIQSHGGWYVDSSERLADAGYRVSFLDRRGSGLNFRDRGDAPSFRRLLDDIAEFVSGRPRPRFLMGVSWGAKLAAAFNRRHAGLIDGLLLIAPGFKPRVRPTTADIARIAVARWHDPQRLFPIPLNDANLFTAEPTRQAYVRDDSLALRQATARLLFESARLDVYLKFVPRRVHVPTFLALAECDRIIDNRGARRFVGRFATDDRVVLEYAGAHHTLEFEPGGPPFVEDILNWLDRLAPAREVRVILPFRKRA
jgi:alpha-beta hydrolase superfamily lysophospholipase